MRRPVPGLGCTYIHNGHPSVGLVYIVHVFFMIIIMQELPHGLVGFHIFFICNTQEVPRNDLLPMSSVVLHVEG
jgi:hypothetical protein